MVFLFFIADDWMEILLCSLLALQELVETTPKECLKHKLPHVFPPDLHLKVDH